jgi:hypothetical protein
VNRSESVLSKQARFGEPCCFNSVETSRYDEGEECGHRRSKTRKDAESTPSRKVVMEKLPDGEETITIIIRGSMMGCHERKAEGSTSAHDDGKWKSTTVDKEQAVGPPPGRSDRHS